MVTTTQAEVWPTDDPLVIYIVPGDDPDRYAALMNHLTDIVQKDLGWDDGTVETIGLIASTPEQVTEGLYCLEDFGIDTRRITLMILWGDTADPIGLGRAVPVECGHGFVALPRSGVVLPAMRMPAIDGDWWFDPLHQVYAEVSYGEMVRNGRVRNTGSERIVCISTKAIWN
jgi:hypothetical protein